MLNLEIYPLNFAPVAYLRVLCRVISDFSACFGLGVS